MVKEKELHRLQDLYAEEIRKHTEDLPPHPRKKGGGVSSAPSQEIMCLFFGILVVLIAAGSI